MPLSRCYPCHFICHRKGRDLIPEVRGIIPQGFLGRMAGCHVIRADHVGGGEGHVGVRGAVDRWSVGGQCDMFV